VAPEVPTYRPAEQLVHAGDAVVLAKVPGEQEVQLGSPEALNLPTGHDKHDVAPADVVAVL
jgi:hypothetical protein